VSDSLTRPSLLSRVRNLDDHVSWREFDERYRDLILGYCRRRGLQQSDAEDVRQIVMLNLARRLRSFHYQPGKGRFRDYLGRSTINAMRRLHQNRQSEERGRVAGAVNEEEEDATIELDQEWEREWMLHHYRLAMSSVRETSEPKSVEVFERLLSGESLDHVVADTGLTRDAVHKIKQRMRERLRRAVADQIAEEDLADPSTGAESDRKTEA